MDYQLLALQFISLSVSTYFLLMAASLSLRALGWVVWSHLEYRASFAFELALKETLILLYALTLHENCFSCIKLLGQHFIIHVSTISHFNTRLPRQTIYGTLRNTLERP